MIHIYNDRDKISQDQTNSLFQYIQQLDEQVMCAAQNALSLSNLNPESPRQKLWYDSAMDYRKNPAGEERHFLHAHYGYAVEDICTSLINLLSPPINMRMVLQLTQGSTRPDIVIFADNVQYAWLDITSESNLRHIFSQKHWDVNVRPFVAELTYPPLILTDIQYQNTNSIASRSHILHAERMNSLEIRTMTSHMIRCTDRALFRLPNWRMTPTPKSEIARIFVSAFGLSRAPSDIHHCIRSILKAYRHSDMAQYKHIASKLYNDFYSDTSQNWKHAEAMIKESYQEMLKRS